jgi:hypothetical protein
MIIVLTLVLKRVGFLSLFLLLLLGSSTTIRWNLISLRIVVLERVFTRVGLNTATTHRILIIN